MMNEMRTAAGPGEIVLSGDGNYAASANGQCLLHVRSRLHQSGSSSSSSSANGMVINKKSLHSNCARQADDVVKRTRSMNVYELSQDLLDKQIELLERKYGGHARANHAARVIQRAFRHYSMRRKFATITAMAKADQRRHSRRFHNETMDSSWNGQDILLQHHHQTGHSTEDSGSRAEYVIRTNFAALYRELAETVEGVRASASAGFTRGTTALSGSSRQVRLVSPHHHHHFHHHHHLHQHQVNLTPAGHYQQYHVQQSYEYHAHYQAAPPPPPTGAPNAPVSQAYPQQLPLGSSHTPYGNHNHLTAAGGSTATTSGPPFSSSSRGELRRSESQGSKRVPPEVPRRTSSALSGGSSHSSNSSKSPLPSQHSFGGGYSDSPHPRQRSPCQVDAPRCPYPPPLLMLESDQQQRRTCNLSTEHSTSEDSLEGAGYSNIFWSEGGSAGNHNAVGQTHGNNNNNVHSSPVPFPPTQYDRLLLNGSVTVTPNGQQLQQQPTPAQTKVLESIRKRQYRVGLNLFNKKPERGILYLTQKGFLEGSPRAVAKFFITRKGISKQMIGEYLGNLQNPFNMATLNFFIEELDFAGLEIDVALRRFQTYFRMPGEAQKIERLMEVFGQRYCQCNPQVASRLQNLDTVFILSFAVIMLNTDLHTPSIKADKRMKLEDFIKNLRGIDDGANIDQDLLVGIYERVKSTEFKPGADHVTQVLKVQQSIVGKKPNLVLPHRRLVCYCRLYEVTDAARRERAGLHQREVFLFNDILVVTKIFSKKKNGVTYSFRQSFQLAGLNVSYFESHHYPFGIRLSQRVDARTLIMFNARNDHDRAKFCEDLREAILEMDEMEALRIEGELDKQRNSSRLSRAPSNSNKTPPMGATPTASVIQQSSATTTVTRDKADNRDSGVADMDHNGSVSTLGESEVQCTPLSRRPSGSNANPRPGMIRGGEGAPTASSSARPEVTLRRTTLSNSLLDIHDPTERYQRRGSVGSLDSGMSISFQSSTTTSTMSRDSSPKNLQHQQAVSASNAAVSSVAVTGTPGSSSGKGRGLQHQSSFLGNIFHKARERKNSRGSADCATVTAATSTSSCAKQQATSFPTPHCTDV